MIEKLIPKDKHDEESAQKLFGKTYEEVKPIIPDLMEWIQDMNWPVAKIVADYLLTISEHLTQEILEILKGTDEIWKYWCIQVFGFNSTNTLDQQVIEEIRRIAYQPTKAELENECHEQALRSLRERNLQIRDIDSF